MIIIVNTTPSETLCELPDIGMGLWNTLYIIILGNFRFHVNNANVSNQFQDQQLIYTDNMSTQFH